MLRKQDVTDLATERKRQAGRSCAAIAEGIGMSGKYLAYNAW